MNLAELIAYMPIRAFSLHGDIGNINHGLGLNPPWITLVVGDSSCFDHALLPAPARPSGNVCDGCTGFTPPQTIRRPHHHGLLPVLIHQWNTDGTGTGMFMSLISFLAFALVILSCRPGLPWVVAEEQQFTEKIKQAEQERKTTE